MDRDVFICHASEDKKEVVLPLAAALQAKGVRCWVDEGEIHWGESITQKVNEGLQASRFVIVVLSQTFLTKNWAKRELNAVLNMEASSGVVKVLPLLIGDKSTQASIVSSFPLLNDKRYLTWEGTVAPIIDELLYHLSKTGAEDSGARMSQKPPSGVEKIPLPKIRSGVTQWDRDQFLKDAFEIIKAYFRRALTFLESEIPQAKTDFMEVHAQKFIARIYMNGELKCQGKVWIGGLSASNAIAYAEGRSSIDSDNSFNELIDIQDDGSGLSLRFSFGVLFSQEQREHCSPSEAAEILWRRFIAPLA